MTENKRDETSEIEKNTKHREMPITVYILECEQGKYYVGRTERTVIDRVEEHFQNYGSSWTKKYKPIKVVKIYENAHELDEDLYTRYYMKFYGIENVRGGSYVSLKLPKYQEKTLIKEFRNADNVCFKCGKPGHYINNCPCPETSGGALSLMKDLANSIWDTMKIMMTTSDEKKCSRCGRNNHTVERCYATYSITGKKLS